jgi:formylglycine-generating enzyme required for sulfatase activity
VGADRAGRFIGFAVDGVVQWMRWIPSGRFWMGSPASEAGRDGDEGPRHEVEIARGFWLALHAGADIGVE